MEMEDETESRHRLATGVNEQELAILARIAGLPIAEDRLATIARDLTATLRIARDLDAALGNTVLPVIRPFDPAWPAGEGTGR